MVAQLHRGPALELLSDLLLAETTIDAAQQLRVGAYQFRERTSLLEEGFFYDPQSLSTRRACHASLGTRLNANACCAPRSGFIDDVFFGLAFQRNAASSASTCPSTSAALPRATTQRGETCAAAFRSR